MARRSSPCIRCLAGLLMLNSGLAHAAVSVTEQVELYAVDGKDLSAVIARNRTTASDAGASPATAWAGSFDTAEANPAAAPNR